MVFHTALEFSDCDEPFVRKSGEGPVLQSLSALRLNASSSTNRAMHDFVTKLSLLNRMLESV